MNWFRQALGSTIGSKALMAISGLALVGFLVAHLAGNLLVFSGPAALNAYAESLRNYPAVLWLLRLGLLGAVVLHIATAIQLTRANRQARPQAYAMQRPVKSTLASRTMMLSGSTVLAFILYHLAHLTLRWTHPQFAELGPYDVYQMLMISFQSPLVSGFYVLSVVLLMLHLNHGVASFFQSLGLNHPKYNPTIRRVGPLLSLLLGIGFISIPLAIWFGFIA